MLVGKVDANSPEDIALVPREIQKIYVKKIYSTIPLQYLQQVHHFRNDLVNLFQNSFIGVALIRIYLKYETDWMLDNGIGFGMSVTTMDGGQIIHYAQNIVMIYALNTQGAKLAGLVPNHRQIQKEIIDPNFDLQTKKFVEECNLIIEKVFKINNLPATTGISWASWIRPVKTFTGRNQQTLDANETLYDQITKIMFPYGKNGNFYLMDNGASFNSAWVEGSIEIVDFFMNQLYGDELFGCNLIN